MNRINSIPDPVLRTKPFRLPVFLVTLINFEYWPTWITFFPSIVFGLLLALRARSLTYFTAANPGIELGGFFGESKINILNKIDPKYLPATFFFVSGTGSLQIIKSLNEKGCRFPVICKPDKGERGFQVKRIDSIETLNNYLLTFKGDLIIQEFIDYEIELGILYYRYPDKSQTGISSVVRKEFLQVTGDGISSLSELIDTHERARMYKRELLKIHGENFNLILSKGQQFILERIGNHCRGTKFLDGSNIITDELLQVMNDIAKNMEGFYFGRFDLKVRSIEDLNQGMNIKIMEVNGTTSEPGHIYDPAVSFFSAQQSMLYNTFLVYKIARQNYQSGVRYTPLRSALKIVRTHFKDKKINGR